MNSNTDSFYIVTNFNTSKDGYFPDNTADDFWTKLSNPLLVGSGEWTVGLCEIQLVNVLLVKKASGEKEEAATEGEDNKPGVNGKRKTKRSLTLEERLTYLQVDFAQCEGLIINGKSSNALRMVPYEPDRLRIFTHPFYVPVRTGYIDTFRIRVRVESNTPHIIKQVDNACITCTLHFKKSLVRNHVF